MNGLEELYEIIAQPVTPFGRAAEICIDSIYAYDPEGIPCLGADGPLIESNGNITICCGGMASNEDNKIFRLGNIREFSLKQIKEFADGNPIIHVLRLRGPSGLISLAKTQAQLDNEMFTFPEAEEAMDICSLCKFVTTNKKCLRLLKRAIENPKIRHDIALLRAKELGELNLINDLKV